MRYGMRIGRGAWVTGGGGVLLASTFLGLLAFTAALSVWAVATVLGLVFALLAVTLQHTKSARRKQLAIPLRDMLNEAALGEPDGRTKLWAVYAVGDQFHYGIHPKKGEDLLLLYPDRLTQIARVALFADAARARSAAGRLQRQGYSYAELRSLFPNSVTPGHRLDHRVQPASLPEPQRAPAAEHASIVEAESADGEERNMPPARPPEASPARTREPTTTKPAQHPMSTHRDATQYTFDGQTTGKGRLVLALVKRYVRDHPGATFDDVRAAFPDRLQAESPMQFSKQRCVVARIEDVPSAARKRFYVGDGETIELSDGVVAVSREWNRFNIQNIHGRAQELGYAVEAEPREAQQRRTGSRA